MDLPPEHSPHGAAHYGAASIAIAGIMLVIAVPALQLAFWLQFTGYKGFSEEDIRLASYGGYLGAFFALVLCGTGVVTGARGLKVAEANREPNILCDTGIYLGLFAVAVWVGCAIAWHSQAWRHVKPRNANGAMLQVQAAEMIPSERM